MQPYVTKSSPRPRWSEHRMVINGVLYRARTGVPWRDLRPLVGRRDLGASARAGAGHPGC
ncbi:transposase [Sphaerimonospora mesophila]|uniref:transposase n=1 Tax=Sphaerimonospora mesophila TaxID=37483 RepID=UPI0009F94FF1